MKAQHNYTTPLTTATWFRWGAGTLLTLAALIVGLLMLWRLNEQSTLPTATNASFARQAAGPIASCRACRDEWVAAQAVQPAGAAPAQRPQAAAVLPISRDNALIASCRACRDEWAAAQAAQPAVAAPAQRTQITRAPAISRDNALIASCRTCRDERAAAQAPSIPYGGVTFEQPEENFRTSGPR